MSRTSWCGLVLLGCGGSAPAPDLAERVAALDPPVEVHVYGRAVDPPLDPARRYLDALGSPGFVVVHRDIDRPWSWWEDRDGDGSLRLDHRVVLVRGEQVEAFDVQTAWFGGVEPFGAGATDFCDRLGGFEDDLAAALTAFDGEPAGARHTVSWTRTRACRAHLGTPADPPGNLPGTRPAPASVTLGDVRLSRVGPPPAGNGPPRAATLDRPGADPLPITLPHPVRAWRLRAPPVPLSADERARLVPDDAPSLVLEADDGTRVIYRVARWPEPDRRLLVDGDRGFWVGAEELEMLEAPDRTFGLTAVQPFDREDVERVVRMVAGAPSRDLPPSEWPAWLFDGRAAPDTAAPDASTCAGRVSWLLTSRSRRNWTVSLVECGGDRYVSTSGRRPLRRLEPGPDDR